MNKDVASGLIAAVVLVAAMAGVFVYERGQFQEYTVAWQEAEGETMTESGAPLAQGANRSHGFRVVHEGPVASVKVVLAWTQNTADRFELAVATPGGADLHRDGTGGRIELDVPVATAPDEATFMDRSQASAERRAWTDLNQTALDAGKGNWTVTVGLLSALRAGLVPGVSEPQAGSNTYSLTFSTRVWEPDLQARQR